MQLWQKEEMEKTMGALKQTPIVVWRVDTDWTDGSTVRRWKLIIEHKNDLLWAYTYDRSLAAEGTHFVQFYKDNTAQMRRCIRKPKEI